MLNIDADGADVFSRLHGTARGEVVEKNGGREAKILVGLFARRLGAGTVGKKGLTVNRT